jgi:cation:H+ antiporter
VAAEAGRVIANLAPVLFLVGGVGLLYLGAEWLVRGAADLGTRLGVPAILVGLTVVSVGTSAPELVVSILAALGGSPDIAIGNVLGSNLANVGLILGIGALVRPMTVARPVLRRDIPWMLAVTLVVLPLMLDLRVGRVEGAILCLVLLAYLLFLVGPARRGRAAHKAALEAAHKATHKAARTPRPPGARPRSGEGARSMVVPVLLVILGSATLALGGQGVVTGAVAIAAAFDLPELLVGLSIVAVGTSLPELAAVIVAALREEPDLALGNVVGSNLFNLTFVLGGTALVHPIALQPRVLWVEFPVVLFLSFLLLPLALLRRSVGRIDGVVFLLIYAGAWWWIVTA